MDRTFWKETFFLLNKTKSNNLIRLAGYLMIEIDDNDVQTEINHLKNIQSEKKFVDVLGRLFDPPF